MYVYVVRRFLMIIPMIIVITFISFGTLSLAPGDFFSKLVMNPQISRATVENLRIKFGLDRPFYIQYFKWLINLVQGDFGYSLAWRVPAFLVIKQRLFNTLILSLTTMLFSWLIAIPAGIYSAVHRYTLGDKIITMFAFFGMSIPNVFFALLCIFFAAKTGLFPIGGLQSVNFDKLSFLGKGWDMARHLVLPTIVLGTAGMAGLLRQMRGNLLDVLRLDYITTARAKGLRERVVIYKHAVRNAINPLITIFGFWLAGLLGGSVLVEVVFSYPGLGRLIVEAFFNQDVHLVMGSLVMGAVLLVIGNLIADLLLAVTDPRIRYD